MFSPQYEKGTCPLLKCKCIEDKCKFWIHLMGNNPQTGATIDQWDCAITWLPILLVENAKESRQAAAATESFRNEFVRLNEIAQQFPALVDRSKP